eukprot:1148990-Pelagomonas_calceolata.AAC.3
MMTEELRTFSHRSPVFLSSCSSSNSRATRIAQKLHAHSVWFAYKLAGTGRALKRLIPALKIKIRHGFATNNPDLLR